MYPDYRRKERSVTQYGIDIFSFGKKGRGRGASMRQEGRGMGLSTRQLQSKEEEGRELRF